MGRAPVQMSLERDAVSSAYLSPSCYHNIHVRRYNERWNISTPAPRETIGAEAWMSVWSTEADGRVFPRTFCLLPVAFARRGRRSGISFCAGSS
jgi:hypothetical protein